MHPSCLSMVQSFTLTEYVVLNILLPSLLHECTCDKVQVPKKRGGHQISTNIQCSRFFNPKIKPHPFLVQQPCFVSTWIFIHSVCVLFHFQDDGRRALFSNTGKTSLHRERYALFEAYLYFPVDTRQ